MTKTNKDMFDFEQLILKLLVTAFDEYYHQEQSRRVREGIRRKKLKERDSESAEVDAPNPD